ncbi:MAG: hypothetical protein ABIA93_02670 [Candidatus Woesearchaeota archaeon]
MTRNVVKHLDVMSLAKIMTLTYAVLGIIVGIFFALFSWAMSSVPVDTAATVDPVNAWMLGLGALAIIIFPIFYAIMGFISAFIAGGLYNFWAKKIGGIGVELVKE